MGFICLSVVGFVCRHQGKERISTSGLTKGRRGTAGLGEEDDPRTELIAQMKAFRVKDEYRHKSHPQQFTRILWCVKDWKERGLRHIEIDLNG